VDGRIVHSYARSLERHVLLITTPTIQEPESVSKRTFSWSRYLAAGMPAIRGGYLMAGAAGALPAEEAEAEADGDEDAGGAAAAEAAGDDAGASANEGEDAADEVRSIGVLAGPASEEEEALSGAVVERGGEAAVGMGASVGQYEALLRRGAFEVGDEAEEGRKVDEEADRGSGAGARDEECRAAGATAGLPDKDWLELWRAYSIECASD
jgi:hypothetical protein